jgi:YesN/AraC family two-component response regulator
MEETEVLMGKIVKHLKEKSDREKHARQCLESLETENIEKNNSFGQIIEYINTNFDKKITLEELSNKFFLHETYICSLFAKHLGKTYTQYVRELRMDKACELIKNTQISISRVATLSGYADYFYFNKLFKKNYGVTPSQYRKKYGKAY